MCWCFLHTALHGLFIGFISSVLTSVGGFELPPPSDVLFTFAVFKKPTMTVWAAHTGGVFKVSSWGFNSLAAQRRAVNPTGHLDFQEALVLSLHEKVSGRKIPRGERSCCLGYFLDLRSFNQLWVVFTFNSYTQKTLSGSFKADFEFMFLTEVKHIPGFKDLSCMNVLISLPCYNKTHVLFCWIKHGLLGCHLRTKLIFVVLWQYEKHIVFTMNNNLLHW